MRQRDNANAEDVERFLNVLGEYRQKTQHDLLVSWIGGEPLLWNHIIPFSKKLNDEYDIKVSATTNGLMLSNLLMRSDIVKYFSEIVVSLDGFSECNNHVRNHENHFEKVSESLGLLNKERKATCSNLIIKVNTILMKRNIADFESFCHELIELGVDELTFNQLGGNDRPEFYPENRLQSEQVNKFIETFPVVREQFYKEGLKIHGSSNYLHRILMSSLDRKIPMVDCNPASQFWFINENGFISPCSYTSYEYKLHINSIKTIQDINRVEDSFRKQILTSRSKWCNDCHCTQLYQKFD